MDILKHMCRLCSQTKLTVEMMGGINDILLGIKPKLIDCCRWRELEIFDNENLPQNACIVCVQKLEQCWQFAESVSAAQQKLLRIIRNINGRDSSKGIFENDDKCDINSKFMINDMHSKEELIESPGVIVDALAAEEFPKPMIIHKFNKHNYSVQIKAEREEIECQEIQLCPKSIRKRKKKFTRLTMAKTKKNYLKGNLKEKFHQTEVTDEEEKNDLKPKLRETIVSKRLSKSTKPNENFLPLIPKEDRNDDGSIKPERILQLEFGSWLMLQYQCYVCGTCLGDYYKLRQHHLHEHPQNPLKLLCSFCKKKKPQTFKRKQAMIDHTKNFHFPHLKYWLAKN